MTFRFALILSSAFISNLLFAQTVPYNLIPDWISQPNGQIATGLGLADINGDGFKDLVIANGNDIQRQRLTVHYNDGEGNFNINPDWQSDDVDYHGHLACGDLDNDGDIDVAVSVYIGPAGFSEPGELKVYFNLGTELQNIPSFISDPFYTFSCALGDADGDGDLDIAAVAGEPYGGLLDYGKIFLNSNGTFQPAAEWNSEVQMGSLDVEFGDFNRDGSLDLIFVCEGTPNMIYLADDSGIIDETPDWQSSETINYINSVDVGYSNGQSIVVMTENDQLGGEGKVRKYDFSSTLPASSAAGWYSEPFGYGSGITLNDVDLDGITDLIYGGWWLPVKIALGDGSGFELNTSYTSSTTSVVEAIQLADLDKVDIGTSILTLNVTAEMAGRNIIVIERPLVEDIQVVKLNGQSLGETEYKHIPGKPWIALATPFQAGDVIEVTYTFSPYPDMVITNWDSNKGDYIFYNTESTVGLEELSGGKAEKQGSLIVWPVPAGNSLTVGSQQSAVGSQQADRVIELYTLTGQKVLSKAWPASVNELKLDVSTLPVGAYFLLLRTNEGRSMGQSISIAR